MAIMNKTILKWAGSKVRIMEQLRPHLPKAKRLVEPFAGSCAVMMNTDYDKYLIADANQDLINLYLSTINNHDTLINSAKELFLSCGASEWFYIHRATFNDQQLELSWLDIAVLFLYLNRHCYNGLCRYNAKGGFNVPFGQYKRPYFPEKEILAFAEKATKATVHHLEWQDTLTLIDSGDGVYCDPPYMGTGFSQYHMAGFNDVNHEALAFRLKDINDTQGTPITVSNSINAKELYADFGFTIHEIDAPRSIAANGNRATAREIIAVLEGGE